MSLFDDLVLEDEQANEEEGVKKILLVGVGREAERTIDLVRANRALRFFVPKKHKLEIQCFNKKSDDLFSLKMRSTQFDVALVLTCPKDNSTAELFLSVVEILSERIPVITMVTQFDDPNNPERGVVGDKITDDLKKYSNALIIADLNTKYRVTNKAEEVEETDEIEGADELQYFGCLNIPISDIIKMISIDNEICFDKKDLALVCDRKEDNRAFFREYSFQELEDEEELRADIEHFQLPMVLKEAKAALINISISDELSLLAFTKIVNTIKSYADNNVEVIFSLTYDSSLETNCFDLTVLATGISHSSDIFRSI
ncbi:hypothetical protein [Eubacterium xylanophilum]|uniref:hypothetical protein n=1 Tax=Eubacterium xylanophilum TaxID=39497 RepID=UPI00047BAE16|nr:hypothetical protein [Eubacterium xylanophilum]